MIPVYICEDNKKTLDYLTKQVQNIIIIENLDMAIKASTENPDTMLEIVNEGNDRGIYILDIDLSHELNGFDVAKTIRKKDPRGFIVFVTTHGELAFDTFKYQIEPMDYILKDEPDKIQERIHTSLINIHQRMVEDNTKKAEYYIVRQMDEVKYYNLQDIIYFETSQENHKVILVTEKLHIEFFSSMKTIEKKLNNQFIRCHRSYLINRNHIVSLNTKESYVIMKSGKRCDLSRSGRKRIEEQLNNFQ